MITLYPYQQTIYEEIPRRLAVDRSVLVYSPMRSGKSKIIAATAERIVQAAIRMAPAGRVPIVLTHRGKIYNQLIEHCNGVGISADTDHIFIQPTKCYVAMKQTLVNRPHIVSQLQALGDRCVLLVDECHCGDFNSLIDQLPTALLIGFSASPVWKQAKHLPRYYRSLIHGPQISALIEQGKFVPVDYYEMVSDLEDLRKQSNGEYTEKSQDVVFSRAKLYDGLFTELAKFSFNKCAIFCASKKSADSLYDQFIANANPDWHPVVYYSQKKLYELAKFESLGQANILITVRSLATGWDYPPLDMTVIWCAMGSLVSFLQTAARPCTPMEGKSVVTELDFGGNNSRFGGSLTRQALSMDRDWNALWQPPEKPPRAANGVAAIKGCPACDFIVSALAKSCSNCGYMWPEAEVLLKEGELVQIQHEADEKAMAAAALAGRRISTLNPTELATYAKERNKKPFAMRVARARTITEPTFAVEYGESMGYSKKWAERVLQEICEIQMYEPEYSIPFVDVIVR